jgi:antitoxin component YwqK of YwqJK toxin-antitoxin module
MQTAFSFDFKTIPDIIKILLPTFSSSPVEKENPNLLEIGRKVNKSVKWFWGLVTILIALQIIPILISDNFNSSIPNDEYFTAYEIIDKPDKESLTTIKESKKFPFKDGVKEDYFKNGQIKQKGNFKNGLLDGQLTTFYNSGKIKSIANYSNGLLNDTVEDFYESGEKKLVLNFKDGLRHGKSFFYFKTGQVFESSNWLNGLPDGEFINYFESGEIKNQGKFSKGSLIK